MQANLTTTAEALAIECTSRWANPLTDVFMSREQYDEARQSMGLFGHATSAIATTLLGKTAIIKVSITVLTEGQQHDLV